MRSFLFFIFLMYQIAAEDVWQFRGANTDGISNDTSIPEQISEKNYKWQTDLPATGHSSPVFYNGNIYLSSSDANKRYVFSIDAETGKSNWSYTEKNVDKTTRYHRLNNQASATVAVDKHGVYLTWLNNKKFVYHSLNHKGKERWRHEIETGYSSKHGPCSTPFIYKNLVITTNEHSGNNPFVIAVDTESGKVVWTIKRNKGYASYSVPKLYKPANGADQLILLGHNNGVTGIDPLTGKTLWQYDTGFSKRSVATPAIVGDTLFATSGAGSRGVESAIIKIPDITKGEKAKLLYKSKVKFHYVPSAIAYKENFLIWNDQGAIYLTEAKTGNVKWSTRIAGIYYVSPLIINGKIYNIDIRGKLSVVDLETSKVISQHKLPEGTHATPAVVNGRLYIRTFSKLICITK